MTAQADRTGQQVGQAAGWAAERVERFGRISRAGERRSAAAGCRGLRAAAALDGRRHGASSPGLAASRFLKASSERRYGSSGSNGEPGQAAGAAERCSPVERLRAAASLGRSPRRVSRMPDDERPRHEGTARPADRRGHERADAGSLTARPAGARAGQGRDGRERSRRCARLRDVGGAGVGGADGGGRPHGVRRACPVALPSGLARGAAGRRGAGAAVAYVLAVRGRDQVGKAGSLIPEQTIETIKEDVEWARARATSARK